MPLKSLDNPDTELLGKRGEGTKYALIIAGLELFGEYGLKATSTRMLANKSGANISAIPYYFGGKEGLYRAVVEYIAQRIEAHVGAISTDIQARLKDGSLAKKDARQAFHTLMDAFADMFVASDEPKAWAQIIMREQANPTEAFEIFYNSSMKHLQKAATTLVAVCAGLDPEGGEAKIRAHALFGQILGFLVSRESLLRNMNVKKLKPEHVVLIRQILTAHTEACLNVKQIGKDVS